MTLDGLDLSWVLNPDTLKRIWTYVASRFSPPFYYRFKYDDKTGFHLDENGCPLCPKCLENNKAVPGMMVRKRTLLCNLHGEVRGTKAVFKTDNAKKNKSKASSTKNYTEQSCSIDDVFDLLIQIVRIMPTDWPTELPPASTSGFWKDATRYESALRSVISSKIASLFDKSTPDFNDWVAIEIWLLSKRIEFATNLLLWKAREQNCLFNGDTKTILKLLLLEAWDEWGAAAFWSHAMERNGKPHPDADPILVTLMK